VYQSQSREIDDLDDEALVRLMLEEPTLLRRPIVIGNGNLVIGHNSTKLTALIDDAN
jgi:regulatory protein spx